MSADRTQAPPYEIHGPIRPLTKGDETNGGDVRLFGPDQDGDLVEIGRLEDILACLGGDHDEPDVMRAVIAMLREQADRLEREVESRGDPADVH